MYFVKGSLLFGLVALFSATSIAQNIVANPTGTQTITQPSGTTFNANRIENVRYADQFGSIQAAVNDAPAGGTVIVPPGYTETLSSNLTINKAIVVRFAGSATISQGANQVIVPEGTTNVSITSDSIVDGVLFQGYTGAGAAFQIGGGTCSGSCSLAANNVFNFYMKGIHIDVSSASTGASGIHLTRVEQFILDSLQVNNFSTSASNMVGILLDGTGYFTGVGEINFPIISMGASAVGIRAENETTDTVVVGGNQNVDGGTTVCFDVNGSELFFYSPDCNSATTALTVEGSNKVVGDLRIDTGVTNLVNFSSTTSGNKIRFVNATSGTVIDNGVANSVEFPTYEQVHGDLWQVQANGSSWDLLNRSTSKTCLQFNDSGNAWIGACGGGSLHVNEGTGANVYFYNGNSSPVAYIDNFGDAQFNGSLTVSGTKSFRIDDPLDPQRKYLYHAAVESPDMKNMYDGIVTLNAKGAAVVRLPAYFEALNKDFRYQLTCIGASAPVYVAREIHNNRFVIAGGRPGLKVSWLVTGVRHDPYANAHRMVVEQDKPIETGETHQ